MILVTGFAPYKEALNASAAVVESLRANLPQELMPLGERLVFEIIAVDDTSRHTEHETLERRLEELLQAHDPALCIHVGQAPAYNRIMIEQIGTNSFMREVIDPGRPVAYWANLPGQEALPEVLESRQIPAGHSFYAGQHLCNHILFSGRHLAETRGLTHRTGFIHIPVLPEQVTLQHHHAASMPLSMLRQALAVIIRHVVETHEGSGVG